MWNGTNYNCKNLTSYLKTSDSCFALFSTQKYLQENDLLLNIYQKSSNRKIPDLSISNFV